MIYIWINLTFFIKEEAVSESMYMHTLDLVYVLKVPTSSRINRFSTYNMLCMNFITLEYYIFDSVRQNHRFLGQKFLMLQKNSTFILCTFTVYTTWPHMSRNNDSLQMVLVTKWGRTWRTKSFACRLATKCRGNVFLAVKDIFCKCCKRPILIKWCLLLSEHKLDASITWASM